jgi:cbb3-type cytochrome oxidase subunit 3
VSLTDIMSAMDLSVWPTAAMVIFTGVFVVVIARTFCKCRKAELDNAAFIPFEEREAPEEGGSCRR